MMRAHEELLPFMPIEETWREIVGGLEENDKDIKILSGCYERAIKDVSAWRKKMKLLRRKQETTFMIECCALVCRMGMLCFCWCSFHCCSLQLLMEA